MKHSDKDTLPGLSLTWEFMENMQMRFAWSETVNRPSLLEITGSTLINPEDQNLYRGNVFLEQADVENFDIRWEWYFGAADELSIGAFYKDFTDPIELAKVQAQGDIFTWFNADKGELTGVELTCARTCCSASGSVLIRAGTTSAWASMSPSLIRK